MNPGLHDSGLPGGSVLPPATELLRISYDGVVLSAGQVWLDLTGRSLTACQGRPLSDFLSEPAARYFQEQVLPLLHAGEHPQGFKLQFLASEGSLLPHLCDGHKLSGGVLALFSHQLAADSQEWHTAEGGLRLLRRITEASPLIIFILDVSTGRPLFISSGLTRILGYTPTEFTELLSTHDASIIGWDSSEQLAEVANQLLSASDGDVVTVELPVFGKNGRWLKILGRIVVFQRDAQGRPQLVQGICEDVTGQREAEMELRRAYQDVSSLNAKLSQEISERRLAELEARDLAERYRIIDELGSDYIYLDEVDATGTILPIWITAGFERITGYPRQRAQEPGFLEQLVHREDAGACAQHIGRLLQGQPDELTGRIVRSDGELRWVHHVARPLVDPATGRVSRLYGSVRDITENVEGQEQLRRKEQALSEAQRIANIGSWEVDLLADTLAWSPQCYRIFGQDPANFIPDNEAFFAAVHPEDLASVRAASAHAIQTGQSYEAEHRIIRPDGTVRWILEQAEIQQDATGKPVRMIGTCLDVTDLREKERALQAAYQALEETNQQLEIEVAERTLAEESLRESEARYRRLVESMEEGLVLVDFEGRTIYANAAAARIYGLSADELVNRSLTEFVAPVLAERVLEELSLPRTGEPGALDIEIERPDGQLRRLHFSLSPVRNAAGRIAATMAVFSDVTEQEVLRQRLQTEQREESIAMLAGGIAHDFNNILMGVLGAAALLESGLPAGDASNLELTHVIRTSANRMADLTNKLLAYARGGKYMPRMVNLNEAVRNTALMVRGKLHARISLELDLAPDLWSVEADMGQIEQVLLNLFVNAIEAIEATGQPGLIRITAANELKAQLTPAPPRPLNTPYCVRISVVDTGPGMSSDTLAQVFEPFFSTKFQGRGLGLAASSGIVRNHAGCIWAQSTPGQGSAFHLLLPAIRQTPVAEVPVEEHGMTAGTRILVIDDDAAALEVTRRMLESRGFEAITASSGAEGLAKWISHRGSIQLLLVDMQMPDMSGTELLWQIREQDPELRVLVCSGFCAEDAVSDLKGLQIDGFIAKPYGPKELANAVYDALGGQLPQPDAGSG